MRSESEERAEAFRAWEIHQKECGFDGEYCSYCSGEDDALAEWDGVDGFERFLAKFKKRKNA